MPVGLMLLEEIVKWLDEYLRIGDFPEDQSINGLQVQASEEVESISLAVDASLKVIKEASKNSELLIVHHGLLWRGADPRIQLYMAERLKVALNNHLSIYAAHLPLDAHEEVGNNSTLLELFGFKLEDARRLNKIALFVEKPISIDEVLEIARNKFPKVLFSILPEGIKEFRGIAFCSGACSSLVFSMPEESVLITGEMHYSAYHAAVEKKIAVIALGHYATELLGIKALAEKLRGTFEIPVRVIEEKNIFL